MAENAGKRNVFNTAGRHVASIQLVMSPNCIVCRLPITEADGAFYAVDHPYYGCMHRRCSPHFRFDGEWPHPFPIAQYMEQGKAFGPQDPQYQITPHL